MRSRKFCHCLLLAFGSIISLVLPTAHAFIHRGSFSSTARNGLHNTGRISTATFSSATSSTPNFSQQQRQRRRTLLQRNGPFFTLDRFSGKVEFGATANLVTKFPDSNPETVAQWVSDEKRVLPAIWEKSMIQDKGNSVFELKIMTLQFVTIQLAPSVDVKAWVDDSRDVPQFGLQSVAFDPNIQFLPGIGVSAKSLGIQIDVAGEMLPSPYGVTGRVAFCSSGILPPPLRILPEAALKAASDTINETITRFAIQNFQRGAVANYMEFAKQKQLVKE